MRGHAEMSVFKRNHQTKNNLKILLFSDELYQNYIRTMDEKLCAGIYKSMATMKALCLTST